MTPRSSTIRTTPPTSRKTTNENIRQFGVPTKKNSLFRTFLMMILILNRKQRKHAIGKPLQDREKEKEKVLRSVLQCRCQRMVNGTALVWVRRVTENSILKSLRKFHSDGWEIREHLQRRSQQAFFCCEFSFHRKLNLNEYIISARIWSDEIQNTHWLSHSVSLNLKDNICWKPVRARSTWENTFV